MATLTSSQRHVADHVAALHERTIHDSREPIVQNLAQQHRIFGIFELLEVILGHLEMRDIFCKELVCRHFRSVIRSSSRLKRKTFLGPCTPTDLPDVRRKHILMRHRQQSPSPCGCTAILKNPLLSEPERWSWVSFGHPQPRPLEFPLSSFRGTPHSSSWRSMQLAHPAVLHVRTSVRWSTKTLEGSINTGITSQDNTGLTLGQMVDSYLNNTSECTCRRRREKARQKAFRQLPDGWAVYTDDNRGASRIINRSPSYSGIEDLVWQLTMQLLGKAESLNIIKLTLVFPDRVTVRRNSEGDWEDSDHEDSFD